MGASFLVLCCVRVEEMFAPRLNSHIRVHTLAERGNNNLVRLLGLVFRVPAPLSLVVRSTKYHGFKNERSTTAPIMIKAKPNSGDVDVVFFE